MTDRPGPAAQEPLSGSRPTLAVVIPVLHDHGGQERATVELIRGLQQDYRVVVIATSLAEELRGLVEWRRVPGVARPAPLSFLLFFILGGLRLRGVDAAVIQSMGAVVPNRVSVVELQFIHAGFTKKTGGLAPGSAPLARRINTSIYRLMASAAERACYRRGRLLALVAVSNGTAREAQALFPGIPVSTIPNGVDTERFRPRPTNRATLRAEHGAKDDECVALFVGGNWDLKGLGVAIEAVAKARQRSARLRLFVVGSGDVERFRGLAQSLGCDEYVEFLGQRLETETFFGLADVFVLPTLYESFSLVSLEAAAAGLPMLSTAVNGMEDFVLDGETGYLLRREPEEFADALVRLAADPALRQRLGEAARRRALEFTWNVRAAKYRALYAELLSSTREDVVGASHERERTPR